MTDFIAPKKQPTLVFPKTRVIEILESQQIPFEAFLFDYEEKGGTTVSSRELGVSEHSIVKTLIMQTETKTPMVVLMHGDCRVATKELAKQIGAKKISAAAPEKANEWSGYQVGGTSPFGLKTAMPIYLEKSILDLEKLYINGGQRGFLVSIMPTELMRILNPTLVSVGEPFEKGL